MNNSWKIFRIVNIIQMACALLLLGLSFYNITIKTVKPEAIWPIIFWIILLLIIICNNLLNHHLLRYLNDEILPRWQSRLHRIITAFYTTGVSLLAFGVISFFTFNQAIKNDKRMLIGVLIAFCFVALSIVILPFQYKIKRLIHKNFELNVKNSINQIGETN